MDMPEVELTSSYWLTVLIEKEMTFVLLKLNSISSQQDSCLRK